MPARLPVRSISNMTRACGKMTATSSSSIASNNFYRQMAEDKLCTAFGVRLVNSPAIVQLAKLAGFHSLFIDLEHSALSIADAGSLCTTALLAGITPFVRVPHQCGNGFLQRILDGGAMGIVVPHVHRASDAQAAVSIAKYPPQGVRSMTGQLPVFSLVTTPQDVVIAESNKTASTVMLMIETADSIENIEEIAQVSGVDVLLVGSNDLSIELRVPGQFESEQFRSALTKVSAAARKYGKVFGLAGIYDQPKIHDWVVNELGARFILGQQDSGILATGSKACFESLQRVQKS